MAGKQKPDIDLTEGGVALGKIDPLKKLIIRGPSADKAKRNQLAKIIDRLLVQDQRDLQREDFKPMQNYLRGRIDVYNTLKTKASWLWD